MAVVLAPEPDGEAFIAAANPAVVLAMLDRIEALEREALRAKVEALEEHTAAVMERNTELKERLKAFAPEETFKDVDGGRGGTGGAMTDAPGTGLVELRGSLTPEYLNGLRKGVEQMRAHNLVLQDVRGEVTLALLDAIQIARTEQESLRARIEDLEAGRRPAHTRLARDAFPGLAEAVEDANREALAERHRRLYGREPHIMETLRRKP